MTSLDINGTIRTLAWGATAAAFAIMPLSGALAQEAALEGDSFATGQGDVVIHPVSHASLLLGWQDQTIYVDPVGGASAYEGLPPADLILITHGHGDHYDLPTLQALMSEETTLVLTREVSDLSEGALADATVLANGETTEFGDISIEAVPAYNITEDRLMYHPEGVGNGYILTLGDARIYIAGDTEDTPEMRELSDIDVAFVPMNLPFTMTVEQAADVVNTIAPAVVYPYHYQGSNLEDFEAMVDEGIEVRIGDWYPEAAADEGASEDEPANDEAEEEQEEGQEAAAQ